jgi:hypothetical protein
VPPALPGLALSYDPVFLFSELQAILERILRSHEDEQCRNPFANDGIKADPNHAV